MTSNKLKILAVILMVLDHYASVFMPYGEPATMILRFIGRFAAPIFCFLVAEGYHHTKNKWQYFLRLVLFALVSHIPFTLLFGYSIYPIEKTSVMWSLSLGLLALIVSKSPKLNLFLKIVLILIICYLADFGDWNFVAVLWILSFGTFKESKLAQTICFSAVGWVFYVMPSFEGMSIQFEQIIPQHSAFGIFGALIFIYLYNGKRGVKSQILSYVFYIFYPLHMIIFYILKNGI